MHANPEVIKMLEEYADHMEIRGENSFRVSAHRRGARSIDDLAVDVREIAARGELTTIPGVGQGIADKITEFLEHGKVAAVEALKQEIPGSLLELLRREASSASPSWPLERIDRPWFTWFWAD